MKLAGRLDLFFPTSIVHRTPGLWQRLTGLWRRSEELEQVRAVIEAIAFVDEFRAVLSQLGIDNARSLVIDDVTVFRDPAGKPGDLPELIMALDEHAAVFGPECRELRMAVETEEAGMHLVLETTMRSEHRKDAPSVQLRVLGQRLDLGPAPRESAASYRERVDRFLANPRHVAGMQVQFREFLQRLEGKLCQVFLDVRVATTAQALSVELPRLPPQGPEQAAPTRGTADAVLDRSSPNRNFSVSLEQRIGALMSGAPSYAIRLKKIESLEDKLVSALAEHGAAGTVPVGLVRGLEELNGLIAEHNRYYPMERNLRIDASTGGYADADGPWLPRPAATLESLVLRAQLRRS